MIKHYIFKLVVVIILNALILSACGSGGEVSETSSPNVTTTSGLINTTSDTVNVNDPVETMVDDTGSPLELEQKTLTLGTGDEAILSLTTSSIDGSVTWNSSDPSVVSVDGSGAIKAQKAGSAKVTASSGANTAECVITVYDFFPLSDISSSSQNIWAVSICRDNSGIHFRAVSKTKPSSYAENEQIVLWVSQNGRESTRISTFGFSFTLSAGSVNLIYYSSDGTRKNIDSILTSLDYSEISGSVAGGNNRTVLALNIPFEYFRHVSSDLIDIKASDDVYIAVQGYDGSNTYEITYNEAVLNFKTPSSYLQFSNDNMLKKHELETAETKEINAADTKEPDYKSLKYSELGETLSAADHSWKVNLARVSNGIVVKLNTSATNFTATKEQIVFYLAPSNNAADRRNVRSFSYYPQSGTINLCTFNSAAKKTTLDHAISTGTYPEVVCNVTASASGVAVIWFIPYVYFSHLSEIYPVEGSFTADTVFYVGMQGYNGSESFNIKYSGKDVVFTDESTYIRWNVDSTLG